MKAEGLAVLHGMAAFRRKTAGLILACGLCGSAFAMPTVREIVAAYAEHQDCLLRFTDTYRLEETWEDPSIRHAPKGYLSVWFDPARQYNIAKAVWRYRPTATEGIRHWEETYVVHDYMQAQGLWTPKETTRERHIEWANGEVGRRVARFRRLRFEVNADFAARNEFTLVGKIDDGTKVSECGCAGWEPNRNQHSDITVREYVWRRGNLVLAKDYGESNTPPLTGSP